VKRPTLAEGLMALGVAALAAKLLPGCAATVSRLDTLVALNNAAVADLESARAAHERELLAAYHLREARCPPLPDEARVMCRHAAETEALAELAPARARLAGLVLLEHTVADSLEAAAQCRRDKLTCEAGKLDQAEGPLSEVRALLAADGGAP
jgi:outer membrane murein-binding lipoprotein Lpp